MRTPHEAISFKSEKRKEYMGVIMHTLHYREIGKAIREAIEAALGKYEKICRGEKDRREIERDIARKLRGKKPSDRIKISVYHGIRARAEIIQKGFCIFEPEEMRKNIDRALRFFEIDLGELPPERREMLDTLRNVEVIERAGIIWVTAYPEEACKWAKTNPEHVSLALSIAGIQRDEIERYLERTFGKPLRLTIEVEITKGELYASGLNNIPLHRTCILPEEIKDVCVCL